MGTPENPAVSSATPTPTGLLQPKVTGIYVPGTRTLGYVVWPPSLPRYPSQFLSTTRECGTAHSTAAASLPIPMSPTPVCISVASLNPWLSDFYTTRFSDGSGCCFEMQLEFSLWSREEAKYFYLRLHLDWNSPYH